MHLLLNVTLTVDLSPNPLSKVIKNDAMAQKEFFIGVFLFYCAPSQLNKDVIT